MPIPDHQSFAMICNAQGADYQGWQKTAETDKIINLLYDQIDGRNSAGTRSARGLALINFLTVKSIMGVPLYADAPATVRIPTNELSYNNSLVSQGQAQFGLCGRFSRVLRSVTNEITYTGTSTNQGDIFSIWCNEAIDNITDGLVINIPPNIADISLYQINAGAVQINTGGTIALSAGDDLNMATAATNYTSNDWEQNSAGTGISGHVYAITAAAAGDAGVYANVYTNGFGSDSSDTFTVTVT